MSKVVGARTLLIVGVACVCAGFVMEVQAQTPWKYCFHMDYAHCGYHPCTCEDGEGYPAFGCEVGYNNGPTGLCQDSTVYSCQAPTESCGRKVLYGDNGEEGSNCNSCGLYPPPGPTVTIQGQNCNKMHDCETVLF